MSSLLWLERAGDEYPPLQGLPLKPSTPGCAVLLRTLTLHAPIYSLSTYSDRVSLQGYPSARSVLALFLHPAGHLPAITNSMKGPPPQETVPVDPSPLAPALPHLGGCFHLPTMDEEALMCQKDSRGPAVGALAV